MMAEAKVIVDNMKNQDVKDAFARGEVREIVAIIAYMNSLK
jgi:cytochrome c oxidase cbb3-type subunit 2